jgi:peptidyl-prolyl cis-trans isomerase A (cyclophilin A)
MKAFLLSALLLGGCAKSASVPPPAAPTAPAAPSPSAEATSPASPPPGAGSSHDADPPSEQNGLADDPPVSPTLGDGSGSDRDGIPQGAVADGAMDGVVPPGDGDLAKYLADIPGKGPLVATIRTSMGDIHCELLQDKAPLTVANFIGLATGKKAWIDPTTGSKQTGRPFYDGLIFHRVIPEFGVQSGDPLGQGIGGPGYMFADEVNNGLTMKPGSLIMANAGPNTNGSQFFITEGSPDHLTNRHTIFGRCKDLEVIKRIARVQKDERERPISAVTIKVITFTRGAATHGPRGSTRPRTR